MNRARNSTFIVIHEKQPNSTTRTTLQKIIKNILNKDFINSGKKVDSLKVSEWSFHNIAEEIHSQIKRQFIYD